MFRRMAWKSGSSISRAMSFNGLANAFRIVAVNGGRHVAPTFAGDTIYAWSEVLQPIELPGLDVEIERTYRNPRIAGFYERMRRGLGDFITIDDLEFTDVVGNFRRIPGARLSECVSRSGLRVSGCWEVVITRGYWTPGTACPPLIYMNGALISAQVGEAEERRRGIVGNNPFSFLQGYPRHLIEGIEVYRNPAGAPGQFRRQGDACGIVLVWTATRGR